MLEQLLVKDFALSKNNSLEFKAGMTCITGETGAGKSLTVDALSMLLGARADVNMIRTNCDKATLSAIFSIENNSQAQDYLKDHDLSSPDNSLILRRVILKDGKSKAYINDNPCTLTNLKELTSSLVSIHGQHASIKLIDKNNQLQLLDSFAGLEKNVNEVVAAFDLYNHNRNLLVHLSEEQVQLASEYKNKKYQLETISALDLKEGDYEQKSKDYDALQHQSLAQDAISLALAALENDEHNVIDILSSRIGDLSKVAVYDKTAIDPIVDDLSNAASLLDEAREKLNLVSLKANPALEEKLSEELSKCHELARRYNVQPNEVYKIKDKLSKDIEYFLSLKEQIATLTQKVKLYRDDYEKKAKILSDKRADAAIKMSKEVTGSIKDLAMEDGIFKVVCTYDESSRPKRNGRDEVEFIFTANKGEDLKPLGAVASGGELSRLALAIEVLASSATDRQTLIFDEVDTGISGRTASAVGRLLKKLGSKVQVITVTHLPQVASCADNQFLVQKEQVDSLVESKVVLLDTKGRIDELSRMMGGEVITKATIESARALLKESGNLSE